GVSRHPQNRLISARISAGVLEGCLSLADTRQACQRLDLWSGLSWPQSHMQILEQRIPSGEKRVASQRHMPHSARLWALCCVAITLRRRELAYIDLQDLFQATADLMLRQSTSLLPAVDAPRRDAGSFGKGLLRQPQCNTPVTENRRDGTHGRSWSRQAMRSVQPTFALWATESRAANTC